MKPWYKKKKVWASILGALAVVLTLFFSPAEVESVERIVAAVLEAAIALGFVFAEAGIDKAAVKRTRLVINNPETPKRKGQGEAGGG